MSDTPRTDAVIHIEAFLPGETMTALKLGFMRVLNSGKTYEQIVAEKQANGRAFKDFIRAALAELSSQNTKFRDEAKPRSL